MSPALIGGIVMAGFIIFIVSHDIKAKTYYGSTKLKASGGMLAGAAMIGIGVYFAVNLQMS